MRSQRWGHTASLPLSGRLVDSTLETAKQGRKERKWRLTILDRAGSLLNLL